MGPAELVSILLLAVDPGRGSSSECLSVWINEHQPSQCSVVDIDQELRQLPDLCLAPSAAEAALRVTVTDCFQGQIAALPTPITAVVERVIQAQLTEAKSTKAVTASDKASWKGAVRDLRDAILAWHRQQGPHR